MQGPGDLKRSLWSVSVAQHDFGYLEPHVLPYVQGACLSTLFTGLWPFVTRQYVFGQKDCILAVGSQQQGLILVCEGVSNGGCLLPDRRLMTRVTLWAPRHISFPLLQGQPNVSNLAEGLGQWLFLLLFLLGTPYTSLLFFYVALP